MRKTGSSKISLSMFISLKLTNWLIAGENDSLVKQEPENETNNFNRCSLGRTVLNWMMKFDGR